MEISLPPPNQQIGFARALIGTAPESNACNRRLATRWKRRTSPPLRMRLWRAWYHERRWEPFQKRIAGRTVICGPRRLIRENPRLIACCWFLLGYSQKEFFTSTTGASIFKAGETKGVLSVSADAGLEGLCAAFNQAASVLLTGIGVEARRELLDDLSLLNPWAPVARRHKQQAGNGRHCAGVGTGTVHAIVKPAIVRADTRSIVIRNAAKREVVIKFQPGSRIWLFGNAWRKGGVANVVAIEIKGGTDYSNVHNRIGEAEKSHRKARAEG